MTDAISPKLLMVLGLTIVVAGVGAIRLLSTEEITLDSGFGPATDLPIVAPTTFESVEPVTDPVEDTGRNPFARADGEDSFTPTTEAVPESDDAASIDEAPIFPNPDLVDQEPSIEGVRETDARDN